MVRKITAAVINDNLTQGMGGLAAVDALECAPTTNLIGLSLSIGRGIGTVSGHQWWVLGGSHSTTINADKIVCALASDNEATITINLDPTAHTFAPNSRVTPWLNVQTAITAGDQFLVQDGSQEMRDEVKAKPWSFRMAIECEEGTRGCKVSLQSLPMGASEIRQPVDQTASTLCVTRLARTQLEWLPAPHGYEHNGPCPLYYDARSLSAQNANLLPSDRDIRNYVRDACMAATPFPSLSRQECKALAAGDLQMPPSRNATTFVWPDIPSLL